MKLLNIFKNVWARVYLNVFASDFTQDSPLTAKAALMEFFLPTTKRKQNWKHWLGQSTVTGTDDPNYSKLKSAFIVIIDILFFFPRLAINLAKLVTEVLPDMIAQLFIWASNALKQKYDETSGLEAFGCALGIGVTGLFVALFKSIYFVGCCLTSPISTKMRAALNWPILDYVPRWVRGLAIESISFFCCLGILFLMANFIPGLGLVATLSVGAMVGIYIGYLAVLALMGCFNNLTNGDALFVNPINAFDKEDEAVSNNLRYSDLDADLKFKIEECEDPATKDVLSKVCPKIEEEVERTLTYKAYVHP